MGDVESPALRAEFEYYVQHQAELAEKYQDRYLVIKDGEVLGDYATASEAVRATVKTHEPGTFLVQRCDADPDSTTQTFHSRVSFAWSFVLQAGRVHWPCEDQT